MSPKFYISSDLGMVILFPIVSCISYPLLCNESPQTQPCETVLIYLQIILQFELNLPGQFFFSLDDDSYVSDSLRYKEFKKSEWYTSHTIKWARFAPFCMVYLITTAEYWEYVGHKYTAYVT